MSLYTVSVGGAPMASDVNQLIDIFTGKNDIGVITFAPRINDPTALISGLTMAAGTSLGVGTYQYVYTFITGYYQSNGTQLVTGETLPSPAVSVTTTTGNTKVTLGTIPVGVGSSIIGRRIYRTTVGGTTFNLLATLDNVASSYADNTADTSLGVTTIPTSNTTGTKLSTTDQVTKTLSHGQNLIPTNQESNVQPKFYGRTLVNRLGKLGGMEFGTSGWSPYQSSLVAYTSDFYQGSQSLQVKGDGVSGHSGAYAYSILNIDPTKYYLILGRTKLIDASQGFFDLANSQYGGAHTVYSRVTGSDFNNSANNSDYATSATNWTLCVCVSTPADMVGITGGQTKLELRNTIVSASTQSSLWDAIRIYEIPASIASKINVDPNYTGEALEAKYPYVDSVKHVNGAYLKQVGKNLIPAFNSGQWRFSDSYYSLTDGYHLTTNPNNNQLHINATIPVVKGQTYTFSITLGSDTSHRAYVKQLDQSTVYGVAITSGYGTITFTALEDAVYMDLYNYPTLTGSYTFNLPQLEVGAVATPFEPQNPSYMYIPHRLASNVDGSIQDTAYERDGQWYKNARFAFNDLDGSLAWVFSTDYVGYKQVAIPTPTGVQVTDGVNFQVISKYDGKLLTPLINGTSNTGADQFQVNSNGKLYVEIADVDSGWGETYTPTAAEIQAYFYGWKMYDGTQNAGVPYNGGTGTKWWASLKSDGTWGNAVSTCPTSPSPAITTDKTWNYYSLTYQLAAPQETAIQTEGELALVNGQNTVTVGEGVVVRELAVIQQVTYGATSYYAFNVSTVSVTWLKNKLKQLITIYQNGLTSTDYAVGKWEVLSDGTVRMLASNVPNPNDLANLTVTYLAQPYAITSSEQQVDVTYEISLGAVVQQTVDDVQELMQNVSAIQESLPKQVLPTNQFSSSAPPSSYPLGTSIMAVTTTTNDFPSITGTVVTFNADNVNRAVQQFVDKGSSKTWTRTADSGQTNGWRPWQGFSNLFTGNGYQYLPGGLIIQWGLVNPGGTSGAQINFPIQFASSLYSVTSTPLDSVLTSTAAEAWVTGSNTSNFWLRSSGSFKCAWIAIGV